LFNANSEKFSAISLRQQVKEVIRSRKSKNR